MVKKSNTWGCFNMFDKMKGLGSGKSVNMCEGHVRVSFRDVHQDGPAAFKKVEIDLGATGCRFEAGDRIRIQICSAAHPRVLRHPLAPGVEVAGDGDESPCSTTSTTSAIVYELGAPARQTLFADPSRPSFIELPCRAIDATMVAFGRPAPAAPRRDVTGPEMLNEALLPPPQDT